ncbi:MAG: branched-chain amino acid ABC transporter permease [Deltaproteobacteria bacterium]|nr:branched-chain amino acid ABC transporter permease [Deltaproteobacteria bacterium]
MEILQILIVGLGQGCVYGLLALGFVMIYKASEIINFSQGDLMMLGTFFVFTFIMWFGLSYWLAVILAVIAMGFFGYGLDMTITRRMIGESPIATVVLTISLGYVLRMIATLIWGADFLVFPTPYSGKMISLFGLHLGMEHIVVIFATILISILLFVFFKYSTLGISMQAASQNQLAAYYMGINVKRVFSLVWAISAMIAVLAGVLLTPVLGMIYPHMGGIAIIAFAAAIIGGFGSLPGAFLGAIIIGVSEQLAANYMPAGVKESIAFLIMFLVLIVRPQGLFAQVYQKKV